MAAAKSNIIETTINRFDGGITNDARDLQGNVSRMVSNFDTLTTPSKLTPYRDSVTGDNAASTNQIQNFCVGLRSGSTYSLYGLGQNLNKAFISYKDLTTGSPHDLDDGDWNQTSNNASSAGATNYELFVFYKRTGRIYGARAGTNIWSYDPSGAGAFNDSEASFTYTNLAPGLVHSDDNVLYVPYDNQLASNNNGVWNTAVFSSALPTHLYITSICEYGKMLAIGAAPLSGVGNSYVFLWDKTSATWSEVIDWGEGILKVIETLDGVLVGISLSGNSTTRFNGRILFKEHIGAPSARQFKVIKTAATSNILAIFKQKIDNRLYFMMSISFNGATREGVWSIGRPQEGVVYAASPWSLIHERTPNNDTAIAPNGVLKGFFLVGDYLFQSYVDSSSMYGMSKTNSSSSYTATSIYESKRFNGGNSAFKKDLLGARIMTEYMPSGSTVTAKYRTDSNTSWTTFMSDSTANDISHAAISIESSGARVGDYKEIEWRLESQGGAEITGFSFKEGITGKDVYD